LTKHECVKRDKKHFFLNINNELQMQIDCPQIFQAGQKASAAVNCAPLSAHREHSMREIVEFIISTHVRLHTLSPKATLMAADRVVLFSKGTYASPGAFWRFHNKFIKVVDTLFILGVTLIIVIHDTPTLDSRPARGYQ
jgi:hypothetical protein